jgi:hypothetical protein
MSGNSEYSYMATFSRRLSMLVLDFASSTLSLFQEIRNRAVSGFAVTAASIVRCSSSPGPLNETGLSLGIEDKSADAPDQP